MVTLKIHSSITSDIMHEFNQLTQIWLTMWYLRFSVLIEQLFFFFFRSCHHIHQEGLFILQSTLPIKLTILVEYFRVASTLKHRLRY